MLLRSGERERNGRDTVFSVLNCRLTRVIRCAELLEVACQCVILTS